MTDIKIYFLPGMAGNKRIYRYQLREIRDFQVLEWIHPKGNENLFSYAKKMADLIDCENPCILGGSSFGGIIAQEMTKYSKCIGCIIIGSVKSPKEFPFCYRMVQPFAQLGIKLNFLAAKLIVKHSSVLLNKSTKQKLVRFIKPESIFIRWASIATLTWKGRTKIEHPQIFHIHGSRDNTFPVQYTNPDYIVNGGGHLLPITHSNEVNSYIKEKIRYLIENQHGAC